MSADTASGGNADKGKKNVKKAKNKDRDKEKEKKRKGETQHKPTTSDASSKSSRSKSASKSKHSSTKKTSNPASAAAAGADSSETFSISGALTSSIAIDIREGSASPVSKSTSPLILPAARTPAVALFSAGDASSCMSKFRNMSLLRLVMLVCVCGGGLFMLYTNFFYEGWVEIGVFDFNRLLNPNEKDAQLHDYMKISNHVLPHENKKEEEISTPIDPAVTAPSTDTSTTPGLESTPIEPSTPPVSTTEPNNPAQPEPPAPTDSPPVIAVTPTATPAPPSSEVPQPVVTPADPVPSPPSPAKPAGRFKDIRLSTLSEKVLESGQGVRDFFSLDLESWYTKLYGEHQMYDRQEAEMRELRTKELHRRMNERIFQRPSDTRREKETAIVQPTNADGTVVTAATRTFRPRAMVDPGALERARLAHEALVNRERAERAKAREEERIKQQQQQAKLQQDLKIPASADLPFKLTINNLANQPPAAPPNDGQPKEFGA